MRMFCAAMTSMIYRHHVDTSVIAYKARQGKIGTDTPLEGEQVALGERVCFGNDRDEVDAGTETLHDFNVEGLETKRRSDGTGTDIRETYV